MVAGAQRRRRRRAGVRRGAVRRLSRSGRPSARARSPTRTPGRPVETRLDGRPTGEYGINALVLGAWGIPVGMVAGDDALAEEVEGWLPWAERVVVKTATVATARSRSTRRSPATGSAGRRRAGRASGGGRRAGTVCASARRSSSRSTTRSSASWRTSSRMVPGAERVGDRRRPLHLGRSGHRVPWLPGRQPDGRHRRTERGRRRGHTWSEPAPRGARPGESVRSEVPVTPPLPRARPRDLGIRIGIAEPGPTDSIVDVPRSGWGTRRCGVTSGASSRSRGGTDRGDRHRPVRHRRAVRSPGPGRGGRAQRRR